MDIIEIQDSPATEKFNQNLWINDAFYELNPGNILGVAYTASGRFGEVTKYRGDITDLNRIDVPSDFLGNQKALNDPLLSIDNSMNISAAAMNPATEDFIKSVNEQSEKAVAAIVRKKAKKKEAPIDDGVQVNAEIPELYTFEDIYNKYNPEVSPEELEVFVWYKTAMGKPLSRRWIRLVDKSIGDHNLTQPETYRVSLEKQNSWVEKGLLFYYKGQYLPAFLYLSGDVYEKKFALQHDKEYILAEYGEKVFDQQESMLADAFKQKYEKRLIITGDGNDSGLVILPTSKFAAEFKITRLESMNEDGTFKIKKVTAEKNKKFGRPDWTKDADTYSDYNRDEFQDLPLRDAFSFWLMRTSPELKENVTHFEIIKFYIEGSPMRSDLDKEANESDAKLEKAKQTKLRASLQKEGERLFKSFLDTELTLNDRVRLETEWNAKYNNYLEINYNKVPIAFTMNKYFHGKPEELRAEKREAVAQALAMGTLCLAFDVGVGKTPSAVFILSAFLDAGYAKRPYVCVPNQVYKQFISEIKAFAPHIPVLEAYNFGESYVENFKGPDGSIAKVTEGCITVMTYEGLEQIGFNDATYSELFASLYAILNQGGESEKKPTQRQKEGFSEKLSTILGRGLRGTLYNIEDFGFDFACYDEAHKLKKVFTSVKGEATTDDKGKTSRGKSAYAITSGTPSAIALKAFMLNQYILKNNDYQNILLLTATPFTNSPLEIFSMLAMLAYEQLQNTDLNNIKNFFDTYVKTSTELVINPKLKPEFKQVILGFNNLISLQTLIRRYINYKTGEDVNVVRPKKYVLPYLKKSVDGIAIDLEEEEKVETYISMTSQQKAWMDSIVSYVEGGISLEALENAGGGYDAQIDIDGEIMDEESGETQSAGEEISEDSLDEEEKAGVRMLRGMNFARNLALSPHLYPFSGLPTPNSKTYVELSPKLKYVCACIKSVKKYHEAKGEPISGQVIYMDRGIEHFGLIRQYLIDEVGFKPHEVGIIKSGLPAGDGRGSKEFIKNLFNGEVYNKATKMFEPVSDDERIKVMIGSSTIKEGINLQRYGTVLYNCFIDWNPTDIQQLEGRIWRQKNLYDAVRIVNPLVVDSMDIFIFQKLQEKTSRLNTIWSTDGKKNVLKLDEFDPSELKYALIRDPMAVANLKVIDETTTLESKILGINRLGDRVAKIKEYVNKINVAFQSNMELVTKYRNFTSTGDKLKDATKLAQLIQDILKKQTDIDGNEMVYSYVRNAPHPEAKEGKQYSQHDPVRKPYTFDEFNLSQRSLGKEVTGFINPNNIPFSLDDTSGLDEFQKVNEAKVESIQEEIAHLKNPENLNAIADAVIAEREAKKINYKTVDGVVRDFAKLNYLLSERKAVVTKEVSKYEGCPPMTKDGQRAIDPEAIRYLQGCIDKEVDTKSMHVDAAGNYTKDRIALHKSIIQKEFDSVRCVKSEKPIAVFTGGSPGSGKSTWLKKHAKYLLSPDVFHLDADEIRAGLPEYKGWNANATHRESQDLTNEMLQYIGEGNCRYDFIYDGTMNKAQKYFSLINRVKNMGYETYIVFMVIPYGTAKERVLARYQKSGRFVPMAVLDEFHEKLPSGKTRGQEALDQLKSVVDGYVVVDGITGEILERGGQPLPENRSYGDFFNQATGDPAPSESRTEPAEISQYTQGTEGMYEGEEVQIHSSGKGQVKYYLLDEDGKPISQLQKASVELFDKAFSPFPADREKPAAKTDQKAIAENQIRALKIAQKYLSGEEKATATRRIKSLELSLKYL